MSFSVCSRRLFSRNFHLRNHRQRRSPALDDLERHHAGFAYEAGSIFHNVFDILREGVSKRRFSECARPGHRFVRAW
jgi:hypothetical protein